MKVAGDNQLSHPGGPRSPINNSCLYSRCSTTRSASDRGGGQTSRPQSPDKTVIPRRLQRLLYFFCPNMRGSAFIADLVYLSQVVSSLILILYSINEIFVLLSHLSRVVSCGTRHPMFWSNNKNTAGNKGADRDGLVIMRVALVSWNSRG